MKIKISLIQTCTGKTPEKNLQAVTALIEETLHFNPDIISLPEVVNLMDMKNSRVKHYSENTDLTLTAYRALAVKHRVGIHIGSLGLTSENNPQKQVNRSFLIAPDGKIIARYDKIHLFDVTVKDKEYRESNQYESGNTACLAETSWGKIGLTICYDLRFPHLFRMLAQYGAALIFVPAAFTKVTGEKHWHSLLRARAIETHAFIVAAAQGGKHEDGRTTYGHSMVVSPDGEILAELPDDRPGMLNCEIETEMALESRGKIPSLNPKNFTLKVYNSVDTKNAASG